MSSVIDKPVLIDGTTIDSIAKERGRVEYTNSWLYMHCLSTEDFWCYGIGNMGDEYSYKKTIRGTEKMRLMHGTYECNYYNVSIGDNNY